MMEGILPLILGIAAAYLVISGLIRIVRRKAKRFRWSYERPHYAVRQEEEVRGLRVALAGFIRIILAGVLIYLIVTLTENM